MTGGRGADVFVFSSDKKLDVVTDFDITRDRIALPDGARFDQLDFIKSRKDTTIQWEELSLLGEAIKPAALRDPDLFDI